MARNKQLDPRARAARAIAKVVENGQSIRNIDLSSGDSDALVSELVNGVLRWYWPLTAIVDQHLAKPLRAKDADIYYLLLVGAYQLQHMRVATHAAVSETVSACHSLSRPWATRLVNGVLRNIVRSETELASPSASEEVRWSHPQWLVDAIKSDWPNHYQSVLDHGNQRPNMYLRVNRRQTGRDSYLNRLSNDGFEASACLEADDGIHLVRPVAVDELPGFRQGTVSVQDLSAQLVADLMAPASGEKILDACAAPGGKTMHLLERCEDLNKLSVVDIEASRITLIRDSLVRGKLDSQAVEISIGDAGTPACWVDSDGYDKILVDAPCSGTGVISHHPDIKHLRKSDDIASLTQRQDAILDALWPYVKRGGTLVYVTCSVLSQENEQRIKHFAAQNPTARCRDAGDSFGLSTGLGRQRLPGVHDGDGFFYAVLDNVGTV